MNGIDEIIKKHGFQIKEVAEKMDITRQTLHYFINQGEKNSIDTLRRISDAIGCDLSEFIESNNADIINCPYCGNKIKVSKE